MDPVTGAIGKLVPMLVDLLKDEYKLQKGVKLQVQSLSRELESAQAALWNLAEAPPERLDPQILLWARRIKEASYDMVEILDTFQARIEGSVQTQWGKLFDLSMHKARRRISSAIKGITAQLKEVNELRGRYTFDGNLGNPVVKPVTDPSTASVYKDVTRLVGINMPRTTKLFGDGYTTLNIVEHQQITRQLVRVQKPVRVMFPDMRKLHDWIIDDNKNLGVLSIVGFGGTGKTTLAWDLYRECGDQFQRRAMVTVSQNSDPEVVLRKILGQVKPLEPQATDGEQQGANSQRKKNAANIRSVLSRTCMRTSNVQNDGIAWNEEIQEGLKAELRRCLGTNRFLLLIDDVWSLSTWLQIKNCLPENGQGSRVIVTTRFEAVAKASLGYHKFHKMQVLSSTDAQDLFKKSLKNSGQSSMINLVPARVWEMCGGLPLAIVTMAGLVASKPQDEQNDWTQVCEALFPKPQVCHKPEEFMRIISYCYTALPCDLKTCSLYLCLFPKGCEIRRKRVIRRWIAEGFVSEKEGLSVEDIAEAFFNQLIERKIIRPVENSSDGKVKKCQVHDMVIEYIVSKAAEEDFATVVGSLWSTPTRSNKVRRLALHNTDSKFAKEVDRMNLSHVRSLTVFGSLDQLKLKSIKAGIVQVLDLEGCEGFKENRFSVSDICKMTLLKYLNLRGTDVSKLPSNIGDLKYLETLDIRETKVRVLPPSVGQLERIRNILGGNKGARMALMVPREIKRIAKTLHVLSGIEVAERSNTASELVHFTRLRKLAIYRLPISDPNMTLKRKCDEMLNEFISSIQYLGGYYLQSLVIDIESSGFIDLLDAMESPPIYLTSLELSGSGRIFKVPKWLPDLSKLVKLTLSAKALHADTLKLLSKLGTLFSLTFTFCAPVHDPDMATILEKNKSYCWSEIFVPAGGFESLELLRIFIPHLPSLNFSEGAMPALKRLELCSKRLEGLHGMDKLQNLDDVIMKVDGQAGGPTKLIIEELKRSKGRYALNVHE